MFDHVSIGVRDLARSKVFYDAALAALGFRCLSADDGSLGYGASGVSLWLLKSSAPVPADDGSGLHLCFIAPTRAAVDAFHSGAVQAGGTSNGRPGVRTDYGPDYYAGFVRDPDGYRLESHCGQPE